MGRKIVVTSGKGGVGKTTIVAGLAKALASTNATVCVIDADIGLNNLDLVMNIENKVIYDLVDCMQGKCRIKQALIKDWTIDTLFTLPSGKTITKNNVVSFESIVSKLASIFDYVLVDSPAGLEQGFKRAVCSCSEALVVVTPHISSIRDASRTINTIAGVENIISTAIIVNRIRGDLVASGEMMSHEDISKLLNINCLGVIPESDNYNVSSTLNFVNKNKDIIYQGFSILANNIINNSNIQLNYTSRYSGILGILRRKLKRL